MEKIRPGISQKSIQKEGQDGPYTGALPATPARETSPENGLSKPFPNPNEIILFQNERTLPTEIAFMSNQPPNGEDANLSPQARELKRKLKKRRQKRGKELGKIDQNIKKITQQKKEVKESPTSKETPTKKPESRSQGPVDPKEQRTNRELQRWQKRKNHLDRPANGSGKKNGNGNGKKK